MEGGVGLSLDHCKLTNTQLGDYQMPWEGHPVAVDVMAELMAKDVSTFK